MVILGCGFLLWERYDEVTLSQVDPIPHTQELITQQRYAEADEYLQFFMMQENFQNDPNVTELAAKVTEQRQQFFYRASKVFEGITSGHSDEIEGNIAGVISDLLVIGDIRDLSLEGWKWWQDEETDKVILALSSIGVAATAGTVATAGSSNTIKPVLTFLKVAQKLGKIPLWLRELITSAKLNGLFSDIFKSLKMCGGACTLKLLNTANSAGDFQRLIPIATQLGKNANVFLEIASREGLRVTVENPKIALLAATYGQNGVKVLNKIGEVAFLARVAKVGYKHFSLEMLRNIPSYLLIGVIVLCVLTWRKNMSKVKELHNEAMQWAEKALVARRENDEERSINYSQKAFLLEAEAAALIPNKKASEPTRSILYCSAASLAFEAKCFTEAEYLVIQGLAGFPSERIEKELKTLGTEKVMKYRQNLNGRIDPLKPARSTAGSRQVVAYTSCLEKHLCNRISRATHIYGCVAWLSNMKIMTAMRGKQGVIIVQSEDFNDYLLDIYRDLGRYGLHIKRYGVPSFEKNSKPLMHNKFILFAKIPNPSLNGQWPTPDGVWTGSFNFTVNATHNLENAIFTNDKWVVEMYYEYLTRISTSGDCHVI